MPDKEKFVLVDKSGKEYVTTSAVEANNLISSFGYVPKKGARDNAAKALVDPTKAVKAAEKHAEKSDSSTSSTS